MQYLFPVFGILTLLFCSLKSHADISGSIIGSPPPILTVNRESIRTFDSVADLQSCACTGVETAYTKAYGAGKDYGGWVYYLDTSDTTSADNGYSIIVSSDGGRYKPRHDGSITLDQLGCFNDASNDCAALIPNFGSTDFNTLIIPIGDYSFATQTPTITGGSFTLQGVGSDSVLGADADIILFRFEPDQTANLTFKDFSIKYDSSTASTNGALVVRQGTSLENHNLYASNIGQYEGDHVNAFDSMIYTGSDGSNCSSLKTIIIDSLYAVDSDIVGGNVVDFRCANTVHALLSNISVRKTAMGLITGIGSGSGSVFSLGIDNSELNTVDANDITLFRVSDSFIESLTNTGTARSNDQITNTSFNTDPVLGSTYRALYKGSGTTDFDINTNTALEITGVGISANSNSLNINQNNGTSSFDFDTVNSKLNADNVLNLNGTLGVELEYNAINRVVVNSTNVNIGGPSSGTQLSVSDSGTEIGAGNSAISDIDGATQIYFVSVNSNGSCRDAPSGWSCANNATGEYTITHNLGTTNTRIICLGEILSDTDSSVTCNPNKTDETTNTTNIIVQQGATDLDAGFHLIMSTY